MAKNSILGVFAKSPIKPLEKHIRIVTKCCDLLIPFFAACMEQDWSAAGKVRNNISKLENDAQNPTRIVSLRGLGYKFVSDEEAQSDDA